ncbi:MAG: hypothetical protein C4562_04550 [Actinobacteria bacterium]|nr:MAG: hypothetical protein C4562_04550 [Actinomycetota bacterium]
MKKALVLFLVLSLVAISALTVFAKNPSSSAFKVHKGVRIKNGVSSNTIRMADGSYRMYYTGQGIMVADSVNGKTFTNKRQVLDLPQVQEVFADLTQISNSAIIKLNDGTYRMIFEGRSGAQDSAPRRLYSAISDDGLSNWTIEEGVRLEDGEGNSVFTSVPEIFKLSNGYLRIYYCTGTKTKSAVSSDEGLTWNKEGLIRLNKKMKTLVDADITKIGKKYVLLFADLPDVGKKKGKKAKGKVKAKAAKLQRIYRAYSKDGRRFKYSGVVIALKKANAMDPDMVQVKGKKHFIYFSKMKPGSMSSDILSASYR